MNLKRLLTNMKSLFQISSCTVGTQNHSFHIDWLSQHDQNWNI